ncbi:carbohydrate ABC transporter permease [Sulfitobacter sp. S190]|uniref:carbohydrate ABC transporter permease n=1 Tax=Sulfitobacter sp. S190 TaxID=2867022 RepID=UPI0021A8F7EE|nr:carbohydrate ABC transporter permease [Sulfitobacter sp. S190]UWR23918.1 carbohydrate ABC transporter permease [Sulfitobacter sp. S190]
MGRKALLTAILLVIVMIWVVPFAGLLLTSARSTKHANETGFWRSIVSNEIGYSFKTKGSDALVQEGDVWVIRGNIIDDRNAEEAADAAEDGDIAQPPIRGEVVRFGASATNPDAAQPGETIDIRDGNFTLQANGDYEWVFDEEYTRGGKTIGVRINHPPTFGLQNYKRAFADGRITNSLINSFIVTIPATVIPVMIAAFAAYAFSWLRFPGRDVLLAVVIALLVVPLQLAFIPVLSMFTSVADWAGDLQAALGLCEGQDCDVSGKSFSGLWLAHTAFGLPLAIYLLRNYIANLPGELIESARLDGATHLQIFTKLVLPLSMPALASYGIFQFLWVWNDLLVALILGPSSDLVLPIEIQKQIGTYKSELERLNASAFISMVVPLIVFISLQRYFVRGLLAGSVKGG